MVRHFRRCSVAVGERVQGLSELNLKKYPIHRLLTNLSNYSLTHSQSSNNSLVPQFRPFNHLMEKNLFGQFLFI